MFSKEVHLNMAEQNMTNEAWEANLNMMHMRQGTVNIKQELIH